tara:strand:+ start:6080 stop:6304 length:225 start_codon:yes stop_codon:yes gene_type:complete
MNEGDILQWAIMGLLLINHIRLNFILGRTNNYCIMMASKNAHPLIFYLPENTDKNNSMNNLANSEEIKKWDDGG